MGPLGRKLMIAAASVFLMGHGAVAQQGFSTNSQLFIDICIKHAPGFSQAQIQAAARQAIYQANSPLEGASVGVRNGEGCNLRMGGGGSRPAAPSDDEVVRLAQLFAQKVGGTVTRRKSAIGGVVWYQVKVGRTKYEVSANIDRGALSYWISKR